MPLAAKISAAATTSPAWRLNSDPTGLRAPTSRISSTTGDSSTPVRIHQPSTVSPMDSRNGTRQPHCKNASPGAITVISASTPEDNNSPVGTPTWGPAP